MDDDFNAPRALGEVFDLVGFANTQIADKTLSLSDVPAVRDLRETITTLMRVFGVEVTDRTRALRELLVYGSYLQNHASHLFVFAAPDFLDMASVFPLAKTNPELFDQALGLKSLGNQLCNRWAGAPSTRSPRWWAASPTSQRVTSTWPWPTSWTPSASSPVRWSTCSTVSPFPISPPRAT